MFITLLFSDPRLFFAEAFLVIFSICCHEFCHAWTALRFGDSTAADAGHLTLNPLKQMGWASLMLLCFLGIAWGQVPVSPARMRKPWAPVVVALAGPVCNLLLSLLFTVLYVLCIMRGIGHTFAWQMLAYGAALNLVLAVLNAMPVPGLDGWSIVRYLRPGLLEERGEFFRGTYFVLVMLFFVFIGRFFAIAMGIVRWEAEFFWHLFRGIL